MRFVPSRSEEARLASAPLPSPANSRSFASYILHFQVKKLIL